MIDTRIPAIKTFLHMLGNIEYLYFVINEVDHHFESYPKQSFESPLRTAMHQLLCTVNPSFSRQSESMKILCYNDAYLQIDRWIQNGGSVESDFVENSQEYIRLYKYFQGDFWNGFNIIQGERVIFGFNTRLHLITTYLRLYAELKQLERELQRYSISHDSDLPLRNNIYNCVECWMEEERKKHNWSQERETTIEDILVDNTASFMQEHVGFLPQGRYHDSIFAEVAVEFIRRCDQLTMDYRK
ncbi:hypothetical protein ACFVS2_26860 [Brevibacillus sp. NPDC058079]|uniref:hypothetical protein n=1 Tax=Brevibacillus sp. NPDC058079 TaxID=3346330 RepID=UPI0036EC1D9E